MKYWEKITYVWCVDVEAEAVFFSSRHAADHGLLRTHLSQVCEVKLGVIAPVRLFGDCSLRVE